jgi:two-component sensor histidine kinase
MAEGLVVCEAIRGGDDMIVDYWIRDANPVFLQRSAEGASAIGRSLLSMRPSTPRSWFERCEAALLREDVRFEFLDPNSGRWYDAHFMRLSDDEFGQFFMDISHRKAAEARQAELFDELNHRVKNNLATVSSILDLHARGAPDDVRAHLEKAIGRVRTISDLHTVLYQQHSTDEVDLCAYLTALCAGLRDAHFPDPRFRLEAQCDPVFVATREAVSLGLIVNELVTNAAKHAFASRSSGQVEVVLAAVGRGLRLRVTDDGVGAPNAGDGPAAGLGLRMVRSLAVGLGARLVAQDRPGAGFEVILDEVRPGAG